MADRRGSRFVLEALFLVVLAVALALAKLRALEIAGIMLLGWLVVALLEWAAWRGEPHYGSGLPPRYYVPSISLPPAQPLEQVQVGYPQGHRDEEATWIAPAALRAEVLGEWPHAAPPQAKEAQDAEQPVVAAEEAPEAPPDRWTLVELPAEPEAAPIALPEPDPDPDPDPEPEPEPELAPEPVPAPDPDPEPQAADEPAAAPARSVSGMARYSFDPLAEPTGKRRFGRSGGQVATIEVPARPEGPRALPGG